MKLLVPIVALLIPGTSLLLHPMHAAEPAASPAAVEELNKVCPVSGRRADPNITTVYEGRTYAFADDASRATWKTARENSLYHKLGGKPAVDAAIEAFYVKVLADERIKHIFDDVNMTKQRRKQKEFLSAAFGGPIPWSGKDLRTAHEGLNLTDIHFNAVAENLQKSLEELKVPKELIDQVMTIAAGARDAVLNRPKVAK